MRRTRNQGPDWARFAAPVYLHPRPVRKGACRGSEPPRRVKNPQPRTQLSIAWHVKRVEEAALKRIPLETMWLFALGLCCLDCERGAPSPPTQTEKERSASSPPTRTEKEGTSDAPDGSFMRRLFARDDALRAAGSEPRDGGTVPVTPWTQCSAAVHPASETCFDCLQRCCVSDPFIGCAVRGECTEYAVCVARCRRGPPCEQGCSSPCKTGSQAACEFSECQGLMCSHACGPLAPENVRKPCVLRPGVTVPSGWHGWIGDGCNSGQCEDGNLLVTEVKCGEMQVPLEFASGENRITPELEA